MTSEIIGNLARRALEREVLLTPKPGLVDAANNGAHNDMSKLKACKVASQRHQRLETAKPQTHTHIVMQYRFACRSTLCHRDCKGVHRFARSQ